MEWPVRPASAPRIALAAISTLLAAGALARPAAAQEEPDFDARLERVRELVADQEWKKARAAIDELLERHEGQAGPLLNRPTLVDWIEECAFWEGRAEPEPKDLVSGKLVSYGRSGGTIRITYTPAQLADFLVASEAGVIPWSEGALLAEHAFVHPAAFAGPYSVEIRGSSFPGFEQKRQPVLFVGMEPHERIGVSFGLPQTEFRTRTRWAPARMVHYHGGVGETLDDLESGRLQPGRPFRIKVDLQASRVNASSNGKKILSGSKPRSLFGRAGFTGLDDFDLLTMRGKVERAWIEGLIDEAVHEQWAEFRKGFDVETELPKWLRLDEPDWSFTFPAGTYPGSASEERLEAFEAVMGYASEDLAARGLTYVERLDSARHPEAFREYLRAFLHYLEEDWTDALDACVTVCRLAPEFEPALALRADLLTRLGRRTASREALRELIVFEGLQRWAYPRLTLQELRAGHLEGAGRCVADAIAAGHFGPELDEVNAWWMKAVQGPRWREEFEHSSPHFHVVSSINLRTCIEAADSLESSFRRFSGGLPAKPSLAGKKFRVYLFSGQASYLAYVEDVLFTRPESTAGLYSPMLKQLLIWNLPERETMLQTVRHEGLHQYLDLVMEDPPRWLNEGLAEYYEVADFTRSGDNQYPANAVHTRLLRQRGTEWVRLKEFLYQCPDCFMSEPELHYAQAWALIHYLRHGPRERRALFDELFTLLARGMDRKEALDRAFDGVDLDDLLREVRIHVGAVRG